MLEQTCAEGKATMLDVPEASARARWLVALFFPLRSRCKWGEPLPFVEIDGYLRMRGYDTASLYDWILVADSAALEWMREQSDRERKAATVRSAPSARRPLRH